MRPRCKKALYHVIEDDGDDDDGVNCMGTFRAAIEDAYNAGIHGELYFKRYAAMSDPTTEERLQRLPEHLEMTPYLKKPSEIQDQERYETMVTRTRKFLRSLQKDHGCAIVVVRHREMNYEAVLALAEGGHDAPTMSAEPKIVRLWHKGNTPPSSPSPEVPVPSPPDSGEDQPLSLQPPSPGSILGLRGPDEINPSPVNTDRRHGNLTGGNRNVNPRPGGELSQSAVEAVVVGRIQDGHERPSSGPQLPAQPEICTADLPIRRIPAQNADDMRHFSILLGIEGSPVIPSPMAVDGPVIDPNAVVDVNAGIPETNQRSFLDKVVDSLENSEFDPKLALGWVKARGQKSGICQKNFASEIETFIDASYMMIANTQVGKTNSFLYLMFKAGVKAGMPSILLTQNNSTEPDRFKASIGKLKKLLDEHGNAVKRKEGAFQRFKVPHLKMTADPGEFDGFLKSFSNKDGILFIPVFVSLANFTRIKHLVKPVGSPVGGKETVCCMLRKHGFTTGKRLKAMVVFDEADQNINVSVDGDDDVVVIGANKITRALFLDKRAVGESGDKHGPIVKADNFFDLFSAAVDVTATPHSLVYGKRDLSNRKVRRIITGKPSKHGFQYEKRPDWESKLIDRMEVHASNGLSSMIDHMVANRHHVRQRHAAVISSDITKVADQRTQALHFATKYASDELITATWSGKEGVSVFTRCDVEGFGSDMSIDPDTASIALKLVHKSFNLTHQNSIAGKVVRMYRGTGGTAWETQERFEKRIRSMFQPAEGSIASVGAGARPPMAEDEIQRKVDEAKASSATVSIAVYTNPKSTYPAFIDDFVTAMAVVSSQRYIAPEELLVNTVVFGKDMMDRGVTVKGAHSHACALTDMYVQVETHYTLLVQVCGRLCGNHYHACGSCRGDRNQVCPAERNDTKTLWATKEVHDMHENALKFIHFLVETAAKAGDDGMQSLEDLLARMEKTVAEVALYPVTKASLKRNPEMEKDFQTMQMLTWKATGGKFSFEEKLRVTRRGLASAHGFDHVNGYQDNVEINGRTILTTPTILPDVHPTEFDESLYFFVNFRDILCQMNKPGYNGRPSMVRKFEDFLTARAADFISKGVFAMSVSEGLQDFILVGEDNSGGPNFRNMQKHGSRDVIMLKYESVCREEFSRAFG